MSNKPQTLFDKVWDTHVVKQVADGPDVLFIDRHFIHEVTSPVAFLGLKNRNVEVMFPEKTFATADHNTPTINQHLPVAVVHVTQHTTGNLQPAFGRTVDHVVDGRQRVTKILHEADTSRAEPTKHKIAINLNRLHWGHALARFAAVKAGIFVALFQRHGQQLTVSLEGPGVVGAAEELAGIATDFSGHLDALVWTTVVQHLDAAIGLTYHDHGLGTYRRCDVVASLGHLAGMSNIDPGVDEQLTHLQLE